ncbi:hypothetical protein MMC25_004037 [Agyrium rufum]|nr:hypothetical protein [Agyrium rufum]
MPSNLTSPEKDELPGCGSTKSIEDYDADSFQEEDVPLIYSSLSNDRYLFLSSHTFCRQLFRRLRRQIRPQYTSFKHHKRWTTKCVFTLLGYLALGIVLAFLILITSTAVFRPSYTYRPPQYNDLKNHILASNAAGSANLANQKIYISVSLYDEEGQLMRGSWAKSVLALVDFLGSDNVFLSIYENGNGPESENALDEFKNRLSCRHKVVYEEKLAQLGDLPRVTLPDGTRHLKRMEYLAPVRNRALEPLDSDSETGVIYDRILFLNDVVFDPVEAAQLLFSTNNGDYLAACAVDFENPFRFYDTFATRDLEGYNMGVMFYPWFSSGGQGQSRKDVLAQKDAVRVKSCWSGMVAADAQYFQATTAAANLSQDATLEDKRIVVNASRNTTAPPIRFRAEPDLFYDASECCLFHADLLDRAEAQSRERQPAIMVHEEEEEDTRIYFNPYIRVAYSDQVLVWLAFMRRFERLYSLPQYIASLILRLPKRNPFRVVRKDEFFDNEVWVPDGTLAGNGSWQIRREKAGAGKYCGVREMQLMRERDERGKDGRPWETVGVPPGQKLRWG